MKPSKTFAHNSLSVLLFHAPSWARSQVLSFAGLWVRNQGWERKLWTVHDQEEDWKLVQPTLRHLVRNSQLRVTILAWGIIKWCSTLITLLFEECFLLWGLQRSFIKQKTLQLLNIQRTFFLCQWGSTLYPDSIEKLDSTCVLIMHTYEKDNLSLVKVSSHRQFKSC